MTASTSVLVFVILSILTILIPLFVIIFIYKKYEKANKIYSSIVLIIFLIGFFIYFIFYVLYNFLQMDPELNLKFFMGLVSNPALYHEIATMATLLALLHVLIENRNAILKSEIKAKKEVSDLEHLKLSYNELEVELKEIKRKLKCSQEENKRLNSLLTCSLKKPNITDEKNSSSLFILLFSLIVNMMKKK